MRGLNSTQFFFCRHFPKNFDFFFFFFHSYYLGRATHKKKSSLKKAAGNFTKRLKKRNPALTADVSLTPLNKANRFFMCFYLLWFWRPPPICFPQGARALPRALAWPFKFVVSLRSPLSRSLSQNRFPLN